MYNEAEPPLPEVEDEDDDVVIDEGGDVDTGGDTGGDDSGDGGDVPGDDSEDDTSGGGDEDSGGGQIGGGGQDPDSSGPGPVREPTVTVNPGQEVGDAIEDIRRRAARR